MLTCQTGFDVNVVNWWKQIKVSYSHLTTDIIMLMRTYSETVIILITQKCSHVIYQTGLSPLSPLSVCRDASPVAFDLMIYAVTETVTNWSLGLLFFFTVTLLL